MTEHNTVAIDVHEGLKYCNIPPYHPPQSYPEYPFGDEINSGNEVYALVRNCFALMGLDSQNFGKASWNPLKDVIRPGDTVLIKPNLIAECKPGSDEWENLITHGSVIRAVIDYAYLAMMGKGTIVVGDAPQEDSDIEKIKERIRIYDIQNFYHEKSGFDIKFLDLRRRHLIAKDGVYIDKIELQGDPLGYQHIDLGVQSWFREHDALGKTYYGASYDIEETNQHHKNGVHEYSIARSVLSADVIISIPKMKTHKKVGVTLNLKGLVGINGEKNWLPHYAIGSPSENGDQYDRMCTRTSLENMLVIPAKKILLSKNRMAQKIARKSKGILYGLLGRTDDVVRSGNWSGNDTCWRMVLDLNKILFNFDENGQCRKIRKRFFSVVDGIIGMEGNGPVNGSSKCSGIIAAGFDPVAVDIVCATVMGFDYQKMMLLYRALEKDDLPISFASANNIVIKSNKDDFDGSLQSLVGKSHLGFKPHFGWNNLREGMK